MATLLSVGSFSDILDAFPAEADWPVHYYHVLNCFMGATLTHLPDVSCITALTRRAVRRVLETQNEMKLIMPPYMAMLVPMERIPMKRVVNIMTQAHRSLIIHRSVTYYWTDASPSGGAAAAG